MQKPVQQFLSACGRAKVFVENEMPIGVFHDFLMELKGHMVDRMVAAHKEQAEQAEAMKKQEVEEEKAVCCIQPCSDAQLCSEEPKGE